MASFKTTGKTWLVEFDGLLLSDVLAETGIDLGDLSAGGLAAVEQSAIKLVKALTVICREQWQADKLTERQFSKLIRGDVFESSLAAVLEAAEDFFPQSRWSEVQQAFDSRKEFAKLWIQLQPVLQKLNEPEMESMRPAVIAALTEMMGGMNLQDLEKLKSAIGPDAIPSQPASDAPENAESAPED